MDNHKSQRAQPPPGGGQTYYNRYQRTGGWRGIADTLFDSGPGILAFLGWGLALICLGSLEIMDVVIGRISAGYMTNGQYDWLLSAATTGLALALIGSVFYGWRERWSYWILIPLAVLAFIPISIDVLNDAMAVDILRFGHFINTNTQFGGDKVEALMHNLYRVMVGGMSALGEPIAAASIIIFPIMKELFRGVFK